LIAEIPNVPSEAVPDRITPTAFLPASDASERKKVSMGMGGPSWARRSASTSVPSWMVMERFGGMTYTQPGFTFIPSWTCRTGIFVLRLNSSVIALSWVGSRCGMSTKAMPGFSGSGFSNSMNASRPPADAPTPTIMKVSSVRLVSSPAMTGLFFAMVCRAPAAPRPADPAFFSNLALALILFMQAGAPAPTSGASADYRLQYCRRGLLRAPKQRMNRDRGPV
jgi:hypothetical protein